MFNTCSESLVDLLRDMLTLHLHGGILLEQRLWSGVVRSRSGRGRRRLWGPGAELSWANVSERPVAPKQIVLHENWASACPLPSHAVDSRCEGARVNRLAAPPLVGAKAQARDIT